VPKDNVILFKILPYGLLERCLHDSPTSQSRRLLQCERGYLNEPTEVVESTRDGPYDEEETPERGQEGGGRLRGQSPCPGPKEPEGLSQVCRYSSQVPCRTSDRPQHHPPVPGPLHDCPPSLDLQHLFRLQADTIDYSTYKPTASLPSFLLSLFHLILHFITEKKTFCLGPYKTFRKTLVPKKYKKLNGVTDQS
jgi:hypothetical protein